MLLLGFIAFRAFGRSVEPVEAKAAGTEAEGSTPSTIQAVEAVPERDAVDASGEPANSSHASAATGPEATAPESAEVIVWGFVRDREKQPIADAGVGFTSDLGERRSASVAEDGTYSMPGLTPGRWFVRATASGHAASEQQIEIPAQPARVQRDFTLEPQPSLVVRVLAPDGRAFSEADVDPASGKQRLTALMPIATVEPPEQKFVRFNHNGRFGAGHKRYLGGEVPEGIGAIAELDLFAPLPLFVSLLLSEEVIATQEALPGSTEVVFVLDPSEVDTHFGSFRLTYVDAESHAPIQGASISIARPGGGTSHGTLNAEGRLAARRLPPGRYEISTWVQDLGSSSVTIDLAAGEAVERTIELVRGIEVSGRCVDELDRPVAGEFAISPLPEPGELPRQLEEDGSTSVVATKDDGVIDLRIEPGLWLLQPQESTFRRERPSVHRMGPNLVLDTRTGPVTDLVIKLRPASSAVVSWSGPDPERMWAWFLDEAGMVRTTCQLGSSPRRCELPPGTWQLRVLDSNGTVRDERSFTLNAEPVVLELGPGR